MRGTACMAVLLMTLAGCADGAEPAEVQDAPESGLDEEAGNVTTLPLAITNLTASIRNGSIPFNVTFSFDGTGTNVTWALDADGDGALDAEGTDLPANHTHTFTEPGNHTATLTLAAGDQNVSATLEIVADVAQAASAATPESGSLQSTTTGVNGGQSIIGRTPFTLEGEHAILELVVELEDPAATTLGEEYTLRVTPPSGGNDDYTTKNGEVVSIADPEVGTYEVGVFPASGGSWDFTVDYCAYTTTHCSG